MGPSVHTLVKHVLERVGQEEHQSNQEELAGKDHKVQTKALYTAHTIKIEPKALVVADHQDCSRLWQWQLWLTMLGMADSRRRTVGLASC